MHSLGILGVGELSEKVVIGLRHSGFDGPILLSPRNAQRAAALAQAHGCQVAASNQEVIDRAELVILGVRPQSLGELASEVRLRPDQRLVSLAAGVSLAQLQTAFPGALCVRAMLSYAAQYNQTTVVVCPPDALTTQTLGPLGKLVMLQGEPEFELATVAACMNGWFYFLLHDLQQWLIDKGLPAAEARALVLGNLQDCVTSAERQPGDTLKALGQAIATPGTFTADGLAVLMHQPVSATWGAACEVVLDALLTRSDLAGR
ncbi:NAD(P)-binding domain-containing protein [Pseudomonas sp. S75]|uniref:NAD(P)-binding domain-containing protein n=1 Tax=unclassified Pseudomonas TaxID=196821 RepID=UPI001902D2DE|nr:MULTISPECIES: NAD(P)-binding domain-containing protein [unclassified Pseudomonas]MBJ9975060.1 NAD(P)-binding domain-containing protein [Pseudomonas sp. S30]MBK0152897.1 NAD(P)-binding domain-containing protein [Pseudomonas sp. S75]